ncbi:MAG: hypothetical protein FWC61_02130 [Proteobacteria bacterium]|nr:hypothetical protein [Pseudomonadota bacterium]
MLPCPTAYADQDGDSDAAAEIAQKTAYATQLSAEILQLDSEIIRCRKAKTNWTAATVVGGIGTVATGAGAIVQLNQIQKAKKAGKTEQQHETVEAAKTE